MPAVTLFESNGNRQSDEEQERPSMASGIVLDNCDLPIQGKVRVRIPVLDQEVWARVASTGAGSSRGFMYIPQTGDEVLVGMNYGDLTDCYIIGNVWNTTNRAPASLPTDAMTKRVIRTGMVEGVGHEVEFDDTLQSITITTSLTPAGQQKIKMDPTGIELSNLAGTIKITMDNITQSITIQAANSIELKALNIKLQAATIDVEGTVATNVKSVGPCSIQGLPVKIN